MDIRNLRIIFFDKSSGFIVFKQGYCNSSIICAHPHNILSQIPQIRHPMSDYYERYGLRIEINGFDYNNLLFVNPNIPSFTDRGCGSFYIEDDLSILINYKRYGVSYQTKSDFIKKLSDVSFFVKLLLDS